jgi:hypothetical protein
VDGDALCRLLLDLEDAVRERIFEESRASEQA